GAGGGMVMSHGRVAMLLCVDTRVIASSTQGTTNDFWNPGTGIIASSTQGTTNDFWDAGTPFVEVPDEGADETPRASWCPEPTGAADVQTATTPAVFVCPTTDVIASSTEGTSNDIIASSTEGT